MRPVVINDTQRAIRGTRPQNRPLILFICLLFWLDDSKLDRPPMHLPERGSALAIHSNKALPQPLIAPNLVSFTRSTMPCFVSCTSNTKPFYRNLSILSPKNARISSRTARPPHSARRARSSGANARHSGHVASTHGSVHRYCKTAAIDGGGPGPRCTTGGTNTRHSWRGPMSWSNGKSNRRAPASGSRARAPARGPAGSAVLKRCVPADDDGAWRTLLWTSATHAWGTPVSLRGGDAMATTEDGGRARGLNRDTPPICPHRSGLDAGLSAALEG